MLEYSDSVRLTKKLSSIQEDIAKFKSMYNPIMGEGMKREPTDHLDIISRLANLLEDVIYETAERPDEN